MRDPIIKVLIRDSDALIVPSTVRLFLNDMELTPLVVNDTPDGVEAQYAWRDLLPAGSRQTATVIFGENVPFEPLITNTWTFEVTPLTRDTLFIEAEDFNYSNDGVTGGLHANFGDPDCSLQGKDAVRFTDYFEADDTNLQPAYRGPTGVETTLERDDNQRGERFLTCDYVVRSNLAGDWLNYTREFPVYERAFSVYLRAASASGSRIRLDRIEGAASTNQIVAPLGTFELSPSGNSNLFSFYPLQAEGSSFGIIRVCGQTTLRLTVIEGNPDPNYLALVSASGPHERSRLGSVYPPPGSDYTRAPLIKVALYDWEAEVIPSSIKLFLDCIEVTARATITDLPNGAAIAYQTIDYRTLPLSSFGGRHDVHVQWQDTRHCGLPPNNYSWFYREGPYNPDLNRFIEAEDFDANGGGYFPSNPTTTNDFNRKGLYQGAFALHDVDYHFQPQAGAPVVYRTGLDPAVGMREANDLGMGERPGFENAVDYRVGWNTAGNWYDYTRFWSGQRWHHVYLRTSWGMTNSHNHGSLSLLDTNGATLALGTFEGVPSGNWDVFNLVPLRTSSGELGAVRLTGERTLRYTAPSIGGITPDINYLMFVPFPDGFIVPSVYVQRCDIDGSFQLTFSGVLQSADAITGPWETVTGAVSPLVIRGTDATQKFWRVAPPE